jgi:hypothetical protein
MENSEKKYCFYLGDLYREGSKVSGFVHRMVCKKGAWLDMDKAGDSEPSLTYFYH